MRIAKRLAWFSSPRVVSASRHIAELPAYQIALWPDGWELDAEGGVLVRDTHEMAEARRWYRAAARNGVPRERPFPAGIHRAMHLHGVAVPRSIVDLAGTHFASERVASVALQLVAGEWIARRRDALLRAPARALAQQASTWTGSQCCSAIGSADLKVLIDRLFDSCVVEGLVPRVRYRTVLRAEDGYGMRRWRCSIQTDLDTYARARAEEVLCVALIPWNRTLVRGDGASFALIVLRVERRTGSQWARSTTVSTPAKT